MVGREHDVHVGEGDRQLGHPHDQLREERVVSVKGVFDDDHDAEFGSLGEHVRHTVDEARCIVGLVTSRPTGDVREFVVP